MSTQNWNSQFYASREDVRNAVNRSIEYDRDCINAMAEILPENYDNGDNAANPEANDLTRREHNYIGTPSRQPPQDYDEPHSTNAYPAGYGCQEASQEASFGNSDVPEAGPSQDSQLYRQLTRESSVDLCEEKCQVCGDQSSGRHYNAFTCEGCKGFFRRIVIKSAYPSIEQCIGNGHCLIDVKNRRKCCRYCRFQMCLQVGMDEKLCNKLIGQNKRGPGNPGYRMLIPVKEMTEDEMLLDQIYKAYKVALKNLLTWDKQKPGDLTDPLVKIQNLLTGDIMNRLQRFISHVAKFREIPRQVQLRLLHRAVVGILLLHICYKYDRDFSTLKFPNGIAYTREKLQQTQFYSLADGLFELAKLLEEVDIKEMCLLSALLLFYRTSEEAVSMAEFADSRVEYCTQLLSKIFFANKQENIKKLDSVLSKLIQLTPRLIGICFSPLSANHAVQ